MRPASHSAFFGTLPDENSYRNILIVWSLL